MKFNLRKNVNIPILNTTKEKIEPLKMKTLKISIVIIIFFFITDIVQAQIRPRIPGVSRAHSKARSVAHKIGAKERRKALNNKKDDGLKAIDKSMHDNLPATYDFEWTYTLQVQSKKNVMDINYFLKPQATYLGFKLDMGNDNNQKGLIIIDTKRNKNIILVDTQDRKTLIATKLPPINLEKEEEEKNKYTITKIGTKTILNYQCQGYKITSRDGVSITYILENAPVNFNQIRMLKSFKKSKEFNPAWLKQFENGLIMEMDFKSSKKKKYNTKMKCIALKKEKKAINISEYKFFGN